MPLLLETMSIKKFFHKHGYVLAFSIILLSSALFYGMQVLDIALSDSLGIVADALDVYELKERLNPCKDDLDILTFFKTAQHAAALTIQRCTAYHAGFIIASDKSFYLSVITSRSPPFAGSA